MREDSIRRLFKKTTIFVLALIMALPVIVPLRAQAAISKSAKPTVKVSSERSRAYLSWNSVEGADSYYVYRKKSGEKKYTLIKKTTDLKYTDKAVRVGSTYYYKLKGVGRSGGKLVKTKASKAAKILISALNPKKKMIALTFDDGPGPYTKAIVNCLEKYGMHATFFVVGNRVDYYPDVIKAINNAGCEIGNHSYSHPDLTRLSASGIKSQIKSTNAKIKALTGKTPQIHRPPYGSVNSRVKKNAKMPLIHWSVDTLDWKTRSKTATVNSVLNNAKDGAIVLMHDIHKPSKEAALSIIPQLVKKGYQLVTVSEMAKYKGIKLKKGYSYYSLN